MNRARQDPARSGSPIPNTIPRTHIHCVEGQPTGITRRPVPAGERVRELPTGHDCMIGLMRR
ncbi:hypothetical protein [Amycolatopsis regifaucium]|uniref:hypothetical protein n=1 Tax=Amycolatopsis regifaucium TaxID=546365 RepID=UPI000A7F2813|nr:hypothetical protein [Amycolatopsis regifaucium]